MENLYKKVIDKIKVENMKIKQQAQFDEIISIIKYGNGEVPKK